MLGDVSNKKTDYGGFREETRQAGSSGLYVTWSQDLPTAVLNTVSNITDFNNQVNADQESPPLEINSK